MSSQNERAQRLRAVHIPGDPVILANVYDGATAQIVTALPQTKAVATASYAIAATYGVDDEAMTLEQNLAGIAKIATVVKTSGLPLTADLQDGYTDVAETVRSAIALGVVGCNLEDVDNTTGQLRTIEDAVRRIQLALGAATKAGVPDFALNARTDVLGHGGSIQDAIARGQRYLEAGATTVFVWGGPKGRGVTSDEVEELVKHLQGRVNVIMKLLPGFLTAKALRQIGVARISVGPAAFRAAMDGFKSAAEQILAK